MSSAKRSKGRLLLLLFFYLKTISFSSRQPNTLHDVLQSLSRIPGRVKFSTAKVPEALWMQSMSVQMDRLESQTLHRFLCSKNSQDFIRTHQSGPGLETKRARRRGNVPAWTPGRFRRAMAGRGPLASRDFTWSACCCWPVFRPRCGCVPTKLGHPLALDDSATAGSPARGCSPAVCGHVS